MAEPETPATPPPAAAAPTGFGKVLAWWKVMRQRLKDHFAEYGSIALVVYFSIFFLTWIGFTIAIRSGAEVEGAAEQTGSIGAAYVATKLTQPLRILATLAVTPFAAMLWYRVRGRKPPEKLAAAVPAAEPPKRTPTNADDA